uniref:Reverse transcriptase zinc-binding domain-containing protein n=1 Tax=Aegilops tauschii subsp. strangulata TaxID=200361 RepID=A0A453E3M2_AEGTS
YLRRGVVLTKDNLARRNWSGSKKCFCTHDETIKHLFFHCKFARSTWSAIQIASNLYPPTSVANSFGHWLDSISNRYKTLIRVGAYALLWSL